MNKDDVKILAGYFALLAGLAFCGQAKASADVWLSAAVASYHTDRSQQYNETNPGLGLEVTSGNHTAAFGAYENSLWRQTAYASYVYRPLQWGNVKVGGMLGLATGYDSPVIGAGVVSYEGAKFGANIMIVPPIADRSGVIGLQLKWRLK